PPSSTLFPYTTLFRSAARRYDHQQLVQELAFAAGSLQLIAGQVADLESEGKKISANELRYIHERKTSALLCCSVRLGGMSANCSDRKSTRLNSSHSQI